MLYTNNSPHSSLDAFNIAKTAPSAFAGATGNARGDKDGTNVAYTLFNVTGDVLVKIWGVCTTLLASGGAATLEVGVTGNTAALIAQTTATDIDANEIWTDATPAVGVEDISGIKSFIVANGLDIIETSATADISSGNIYYVCLWRPLTPGSKVVAADPA